MEELTLADHLQKLIDASARFSREAHIGSPDEAAWLPSELDDFITAAKSIEPGNFVIVGKCIECLQLTPEGVTQNEEFVCRSCYDNQ